MSDDRNPQVFILNLKLPNGEFRELKLFHSFLSRYTSEEITQYLTENTYIRAIEKGDTQITDILRR
jgi:hypothetical protein